MSLTQQAPLAVTPPPVPAEDNRSLDELLAFIGDDPAEGKDGERSADISKVCCSVF